MAKRYERNQKRQHRQEIERLGHELTEANRAYTVQQRRAASAKDDAFQEFAANGDRINHAMDLISRELGKAMGPHFAPHVAKLVESSKHHQGTQSGSFVAFTSMSDPIDFRVLRIEGRIEPIHYCIQVSLD